MIPLVLPRLSISMEEGVVLAWLVEDGAHVTAGQPVVEIETDKSTLEVEAPAAGVVRIVLRAGSIAPVDAVLAEIHDLGVEAMALSEDVVPPASASSGAGEAHIASPAARRLAREGGIDLVAVAGTGPGGRIVVRDVERAVTTVPAAPVEIAVDDLHGLVVGSIVTSWREIPHIHVAGELVADGLAEARRQLATREGDVRVTVTDLLIVAVSRALSDVRDLNGVVRPDGSVNRSDSVLLGLAVATAAGVVAPVIRDAAVHTLAAVARERRRIVEAARSGVLDKRDLGGATCTLSNLGSYPVDFFAPVISEPQIALVAVGRLAEKPVAVDGMLAVRHRLWVNVAIDHRGADGEAGGRFLAALEERLVGLPALCEAEGASR